MIEEILDKTIAVILIGFPALMCLDFMVGVIAVAKDITATPVVESENKPSSNHSKLQNKLTFDKLKVRFTHQGFILERSRSGHYRYRVLLTSESKSPKYFKNLDEAQNWLLKNHKLALSA